MCIYTIEIIVNNVEVNRQIGVSKAFNSLEALVIFQRVADSGINGIDNTLLARSVLPHITRKQYYLRMAALKQAGLISRTRGKYRLTSLGLVIRNSLRIIEKGIKFKWPLRALDVKGPAVICGE